MALGKDGGRFGVDFDPLKISCSRVLTGAVIRCTSHRLYKASLSLGTRADEAASDLEYETSPVKIYIPKVYLITIAIPVRSLHLSIDKLGNEVEYVEMICKARFSTHSVKEKS